MYVYARRQFVFIQPFHCKSGIDNTGSWLGSPGLTCDRLVGALLSQGQPRTQRQISDLGIEFTQMRVQRRVEHTAKVGRCTGASSAHAGERCRSEVLCRTTPPALAIPLVESLDFSHHIRTRSTTRAITPRVFLQTSCHFMFYIFLIPTTCDVYFSLP